jgi:hypothetical protein
MNRRNFFSSFAGFAAALPYIGGWFKPKSTLYEQLAEFERAGGKIEWTSIAGPGITRGGQAHGKGWDGPIPDVRESGVAIPAGPG